MLFNRTPTEIYTWPPKTWLDIYNLYAEHAAWYSGDPARLLAVYVAKAGQFWAREIAERRTMLHVPVAGDISSTSAAMLFSEPPKITVEDERTGARLEEIIREGCVIRTLLEAADSCSALGGVCLKVNWDKSLSPYPILSVVEADNALPEFSFGVLTHCVFHQQVEIEQYGGVWMHREIHERGVIRNELRYSGDVATEGELHPLTDHPATKSLLPELRTGIEGLACVYVPNVRPNRRFRGSALGRSDYSGVEGIFDSIDEAWSSWMRDIRLGQGRIIAPAVFFEVDTTGAFKFDLDKEAYLGLNAPMGGSGAKDEITYNQFAIRAQEHGDTISALLRQAYQSAGYAPQTFGLDIQGGAAESGTALTIRERKSFVTTAGKAEYWRPAVARIAEIMLGIDRAQLGSGVAVERPNVIMGDSVQTDFNQVATSVEMLNRAVAVSTEIKVRMVHPDWDDTQVAEEVTRIQSESGQAVPSPLQVGIA